MYYFYYYLYSLNYYDDSIFAAAKVVKNKFGYLNVLVNNTVTNR